MFHRYSRRDIDSCAFNLVSENKVFNWSLPTTSLELAPFSIVWNLIQKYRQYIESEVGCHYDDEWKCPSKCSRSCFPMTSHEAPFNNFELRSSSGTGEDSSRTEVSGLDLLDIDFPGHLLEEHVGGGSRVHQLK
ncbi:hypothetical protein BLNAU_6652 [Blattamonas nauphoetae]|uniref:Uncharacterized protein n=1 Tax=Blattamonas nauphoetae TaxID=2049346 RepID=A0ABQ9Y3Q0_9EUKA|nr:hypothetical protein BLNAU_6652 [Blattamonas nauphoetae]